MKTKIKHTTLLAALSLVMGASVSAKTQPNRLVVSYDAPAQYVSTLSLQRDTITETCFTLPSGADWCVPAPAERVSAQSTHSKQTLLTLKSHVVVVPDELSEHHAMQLLTSSGLYRFVEKDVMISTTGAWSTVTTPDDPSFNNQYYFSENSDTAPNASSILKMWGMIKAPEKNVDVYVMDTGFRLGDDLDYAPGFNFSRSEAAFTTAPGFLESDFDNSEKGCFNNHGVGVAAVIGAKINNGIGIAGTTGNVTVHPLRVMHCGAGYMSDVALAMRWLNGEPVENIPDFTGSPGVINLSLGGEHHSTTCPNYIQAAIDKVIAKGFVVVAAAGNANINVEKQIPAMCDGVITVGASNEGNGYTPADKARFSNYGEKIDIMAAGVSVPSLSSDNSVINWAGTSFASPLVAGIIATVSKDFSFTPDQWNHLVRLSGVARWVEGSECASLGCGSGILNADRLYANAKLLKEGRLDEVTLTLNAVPACRHQWMMDNLSKGQSLCDQVSLKLGSFVQMKEGETLKIHAVFPGESVVQDSSLVGQYSTYRITMDKSALENKTVYAQQCDAQGQCGALIPVNTQGLADIPVACKP